MDEMNKSEIEIIEVDENSVSKQKKRSLKTKKNKKQSKHPALKGYIGGFITAGLIAALVVALVKPSATPKPVHVTGGMEVLDEEVMSKIEVLGNYISEGYYEDVDRQTLVTGLYKGLFTGLDQYSEYYTAEEYQDLFESTIAGTYCGIGATLRKDPVTGYAVVIKITEGSPAEEAGLEPDDVIMNADEYDAAEMELSDFVNHIKGEEHSKVKIKVHKDASGENVELEIERRVLNIVNVTCQMMDDGIGYIQISEFTDVAPDQFTQCLDELKSQGMKKLIIDVRSNPGGLVNAATNMLDELLPEGLLVYTEDRAGKKVEYNSTDDASLDMPMVVLVDGYTISAAEIFSGAMKDRGAATLVGTKTYGKGVVQSVVPLSDGSAVKLTTSKYFTPAGTCIHGIGIEPDVEVEYEFLGEKDQIYSTDLDNQIQKAIEILKDAK